MKQPSLLKHLRDILILPVTVTVIVPYFIYDPAQVIIPDDKFLKLLALPVFVFGLAFFLYTVYLFRAFGRGTLAPWAATQTLIIRGPYKYCRNPMITGVFFILISETIFLNSQDLLIWAGSFFLINTVYFILKEEPDMYKRFGEPYLRYKENVPRWIPRLRPFLGNSEQNVVNKEE